MNFLNQVLIEGYATSKPNITETSKGKIAKFSICYNQIRKLEKPDENGYNYESIPHFFNVVSWNDFDVLEKIEKGQALSISGELRFSSWTNDKGEKKSNIFIKAATIKKLEKIEKEISDAPNYDEIPF